MTGMLEKFVICLVIVGICAGVYFYCDKENIDLCFTLEEKEWCILKNED